MEREVVETFEGPTQSSATLHASRMASGAAKCAPKRDSSDASASEESRGTKRLWDQVEHAARDSLSGNVASGGQATVHMKWALLLHQHLQEVEREVHSKKLVLARLLEDNRSLRRSLFGGDSALPEGGAASAPAASAAEFASLDALTRGNPTVSEVVGARAMSGYMARDAEPHAELLSTPNLQLLAAFLNERTGA